jgi:hypothetical protein
MRRPSHRGPSFRVSAVALAAMSLGLAACGGSGGIGAAGSQDPAVTALGSASASSRAGSGRATPSGKATPKNVEPSPAGTGPSPVALPWSPSPDVPVEGTLSPTCVRRGGTVTLKVHTRPKAAVAYVAVYSDSGNGAPKPFGNGYGGNDKGFSTPDGDYVSAFTVSFDAPSGPARVDVIVGWENKWGYDGPTFAVAGSNGAC